MGWPGLDPDTSAFPWNVVTHSKFGIRGEAIHWTFKSNKSDSILGACWRLLALRGRQLALNRGHSWLLKVISGKTKAPANTELSSNFLRTPNGIRTRAATLKGWCPRPLDDGGLCFFTLNNLVVGLPGFEPGTSASRTQRATKLRYSPRRVPSQLDNATR